MAFAMELSSNAKIPTAAAAGDRLKGLGETRADAGAESPVPFLVLLESKTTTEDSASPEPEQPKSPAEPKKKPGDSDTKEVTVPAGVAPALPPSLPVLPVVQMAAGANTSAQRAAIEASVSTQVALKPTGQAADQTENGVQADLPPFSGKVCPVQAPPPAPSNPASAASDQASLAPCEPKAVYHKQNPLIQAKAEHGTPAAEHLKTMVFDLAQDKIAENSDRDVLMDNFVPPKAEAPQTPATGAITVSAEFHAPVKAEEHTAIEVTHSSVRETPLLDGIREQAILLQHARKNEISVVLAPEPGVRLHLNLKKSPDGISISATAGTGAGYEVLNGQWKNLQNQLSAQGIQLGRLEKEGASDLSRFDGQPGEGGRKQTVFEEETILLSPVISKPAPRKSAKVSSDNGWQFWA